MPENSFSFKLPRSNLLVECEVVTGDSWLIRYVNPDNGKTRELDRQFSGKQMLAITDFLIDASARYGIYR